MRTMKPVVVIGCVSRPVWSFVTTVATLCVWSVQHSATDAFEFGSHNDMIETKDYCLHESFNASCPPGEVVMMTSAIYGRMRLGRCISGDFNIGCSKDVISYFDSQCTARRNCDVSVRNLVDIHPCQRDFMSYLEASFTCLRVAAQSSASCRSQRHLVVPADVTDYLVYGGRLVSSAESAVSGGTAARMTPGARVPDAAPVTEPGTRACPWVVTAQPGQRLKFTIVVVVEIDLSGGTQLNEDAVVLPSSMICHETLVINDSPLGSREPPAAGSAVRLPVCSGRLRERLIYLSVGHVVSLYVELNDDDGHAQPLAPPAGRGLAGSNDASGSMPLTRFILNYESVGCPDLTVPPNAMMRRTGDNVMIRCNESLETWYMTCQGNRWIGDVTNCSLKELQLGDNDSRKQTIIPAQGLVLAVLLGIAFGICIGLILLVVLHCARRRSSNLESSKRKAVLAVQSGEQMHGNEDDLVQPSTVTRLYQPMQYSSTHHTSTLNITQSGMMPLAGDFDPYCSPHYVYHAGGPGGNYFSTYCRGSAEPWNPYPSHVIGSSRTTEEQYPAAEVDSELDARIPRRVGTILASTAGSTGDVGGTFYPAALRTPDKPLFHVCVSSESGCCVGRMAVESTNIESCQTCYTTNNQLTTNNDLSRR